jgi:hypothetical protein
MARRARIGSVSEIVSPIACAALTLMTDWYLDACSAGRSAGLAPLRILLDVGRGVGSWRRRSS